MPNWAEAEIEYDGIKGRGLGVRCPKCSHWAEDCTIGKEAEWWCSRCNIRIKIKYLVVKYIEDKE